MNSQTQKSHLEGPVNGLDRSSTVTRSSLNDGSKGIDNDIVRDVEIVQPSSGQEAKNNDVQRVSKPPDEESEIFHSVDHEMDDRIWEPPEPEDPENDMEGSVAYNDDDDECGDGTMWGKPCSLSHFRDEGSGSFKFKEEKQRAMEEVVSGKFKHIVSQLLVSSGVASLGNDGKSWVDIVTSLSWEAASSLKPDVVNGKAVDPNGYVKVKCIATGFRSESQVIKGLVFKKNAVHKHMPTKFKNPKLLLIRGMLGQSSNGLSSFNAMEQEKGYQKSVMEMIELCQPNVVLVEKTVSRDIQESILAKGMTLVFDMKLHRLEQVARCTGSPVLSSDTLTSQKLKQCDSFRIEKFVEEHATFSESGKWPSKTLMFIDGCPTRLGCTVLLKGSRSDELKKIKYVVQCAVVMAYHLILETSFLVDQRAMFSTIPFAVEADVLQTVEQYPTLENGNSNVPCLDDSTAETESSMTNIPISNGLREDLSYANSAFEGDSMLSYEPYNPAIFSGFSSRSASLKKVIEDGFPLSSAASSPSVSSYFGLCGREPNDQITEEVPVTNVSAVSDNCEMEAKSSSDEEKSLDGQPPSLSVCSEARLNIIKNCGADDNQLQSKEDANAALDSQSILVLMSSRNALKGTICEQSHFSHIMFYKNFDIPLGKFLQDNLLNQGSHCTTCGELPESHFYYYAHRNKQLTVQVKRLLDEKCLPGEAEGKLWMWSRCGKCKTGDGVSKSTKRVLISTASCGLSFGKFLELSLSHHSSSRSSSCGHSLHWDFFHFFGFGPMVAMLRYSSVTTYTVTVPSQKLEFGNSINKEWLKTTYAVTVPPQKLEFGNSINKEWLKEEFQNLHTIGILLFTEIESSLKQIESRYVDPMLNLQVSLKELCVIMEMLKQERAAFEVSIQNVVAKNGSPDEAFYKLLSLNRLRWELLLESCFWDKRLHSLLPRDPAVVISGPSEKEVQEQPKLEMEGTAVGGNEGQENHFQSGDNSNELLVKEIQVDGRVQSDASERTTLGLIPNGLPNQNVSVKPVDASNHHPGDNNLRSENVFSPKNLVVEKPISNFADVLNNDFIADPNASERSYSPRPLLANLEKLNGWFWMPFSELRQIYMKDLRRGYVPKFECVSSYTSEHLPAIYKLICDEGSRLHIPLGTDNYIVSDYEGELSSVIACVLALLKDLPVSAAIFNEDSRKDSEMTVKRTESLNNLNRIPIISSPHWSINGSSDSDSIRSALSISSEESHCSSFDGLNLLESPVPSPEVSIGCSKSLAKGKYSVKCLYANQFRDLRSRCCPSELDYIDSLSRCKTWDAKGGKSKSFFSKTLDDRFIIKKIKKTEFDSFEKFALHYFKYMNESFDFGSQTCLAKVLGIYQVTVRLPESGKEMRHDLMVMENLTYGHNIVRQYDLKGALHGRFNSVVDGSGDVLLDQNFVNDMNTSPVYVSNKAKRLLQQAIWNDTAIFLNPIDVMDYSLLVGVDTRRRVLVCGIIDYLRQYTWDKALESWVKSSLVPGNVRPTVISPQEYKKRFRKFMSTHFLSV